MRARKRTCRVGVDGMCWVMEHDLESTERCEWIAERKGRGSEGNGVGV